MRRYLLLAFVISAGCGQQKTGPEPLGWSDMDIVGVVSRRFPNREKLSDFNPEYRRWRLDDRCRLVMVGINEERPYELWLEAPLTDESVELVVDICAGVSDGDFDRDAILSSMRYIVRQMNAPQWPGASVSGTCGSLGFEIAPRADGNSKITLTRGTGRLGEPLKIRSPAS